MSRYPLLAGILLAVTAGCGGNPAKSDPALAKSIQLQPGDVVFKPAPGDTTQRWLFIAGYGPAGATASGFQALMSKPINGASVNLLGGTVDLNVDYDSTTPPADDSGPVLDQYGHLACAYDGLYGGQLFIRGRLVTRTHDEEHPVPGCAVITVTEGAFKIVDSTGRIE
jgi:hypothetical protein